MITGKNGHVIDRYQYDAHGSPYTGRFEQGNNMNSYGFTGQRYEARLGVYTFAYRTYNPRVMRWITPDPVRDGMNWYTYVNGDPVNLWDPLGLDLVVLNDSDAVPQFGGPHGHNAALIGDEKNGWTYFSKDGKKADENIDDSRKRTENRNYSQHYDSLKDFKEDEKISGRYDRMAIIDTTDEQDKAMIEEGKKVYDRRYDLTGSFYGDNCADLVEEIADAGDINLSGADIPYYVPVDYHTVVEIDVTQPNAQYDIAKGMASFVIEDGEVILDKSDEYDACSF